MDRRRIERLGRATASALHHAGARVIVSARNEQALLVFARQHPGALALALDAGDRAAVQDAARSIVAVGGLDLVLYCAGYYREQRAGEFDLAEMLSLDLRDRRIGVSLICPGFVATRLTAQNQFEMPALITPEQSAQAILDGWARGRFELHFPRRFTLAMKLLRLLPLRLYRTVVRRATGL